ncbi:MAG: T9SS type A sorting domain-containing protein [Bacteroidetes bacterium]|nr:T9SS type A sorting domain-containing protein [Bacteroidota bacterium]
MSAILLCVKSWGQTVVFIDDFNRASVSPGGTPSMTYTTTSPSSGCGASSINSSSFLELTNCATAGRVFVTGTLSTFSCPFSGTLSSNPGLITWTFNFRYNRTTNPSGFGSTSYGVAIALAASSSDLMTANGYAIAYGNSSTPDPIRLVKFASGLDLDGNITNIISSGASDISAVNNYVSIRVTYDPAGDNWSLFIRDDGAAAWSDPSSGVTNQIGSTTSDNTYTGVANSNFGFLWNYSTAASQTARFDNFKVTVVNGVPSLSCTETHADASCNGSNNGSIDVTVMGGNSPYTYSWNDGPATEDRTNIASGSYTVTVSDACSNTTSKTVILTAPPLESTLLESFCDGEFTSNPVWSGDAANWQVVYNSTAAAGSAGSNTLRLNAASAGTQYLSTQIATWGDEQEWGFWIGRRDYAFTDLNNIYIWLYANESNLESGTVDGYRIKIGDDSGDDELVLQRVTNGTATDILTSSGSILNGITDIGFLVRVTRSSCGDWQLFTSTLPSSSGTGEIARGVPNSANASVLQGNVTNSAYTPASNGYFGIIATHTGDANAMAALEFDQILFNATAFTPFSGYFRSKQSGYWCNISTWEQSSDNISWNDGTDVPDFNDNEITIRAGHSVTIGNSSLTIDETTVQTGGVLIRAGTGSAGDVFTINNGSGDDLIISGTYRNTDANDGRHTGTGKVRIKKNGIFEATVNPGGEIDYYANDQDVAFAANIVWEDSSVFYWNTSTAFSNSGITYFPNVTASETPVFRVNGNMAVGGASNTTVNGIFEVSAGKNVTWQWGGTKSFRNGIQGAGSIVQATGASFCGPFTITGQALLGGSGAISLNSNGLEITATGYTTLTSGKTINNDAGSGSVVVNGTLNARTYSLSGTSEFALNSGALLVTAHSGGVTGSVTVADTKTFDAGANYTFNGTVAQVTGTLMGTPANNVTINNTATYPDDTVRLTQLTTITGTLSLIAGDLMTSSSRLITLADNAGAVGANDNSYVGGPCRKLGNDDFVFPVGAEDNYNPVKISSLDAVADDYTAQYYFDNPRPIYDETQKDATIDHISGMEYWTVVKNSGTDAYVWLYWDNNSGGVTSLADMMVCRWNGSMWKDHDNGATTGNTSAGSVRSLTEIFTFSPFTLGSKIAVPGNPLPVELLKFTAVESNGNVILSWTTASETNNDYFTIERAAPSNSPKGEELEWIAIGTVKGAGNSSTIRQYEFTDPLSDGEGKGGTLYYRLKQTDYDGRYEYFGHVAVEILFSKTIALYPNPVKDEMVISINGTGEDEATVKIYNITGQVVYSRLLTNGFNSFIFNANRLPPGIYYITGGWNGEGMRFVKE